MSAVLRSIVRLVGVAQRSLALRIGLLGGGARVRDESEHVAARALLDPLDHGLDVPIVRQDADPGQHRHWNEVLCRVAVAEKDPAVTTQPLEYLFEAPACRRLGSSEGMDLVVDFVSVRLDSPALIHAACAKALVEG